jgi:hypothetical protein
MDDARYAKVLELIKTLRNLRIVNAAAADLKHAPEEELQLAVLRDGAMSALGYVSNTGTPTSEDLFPDKAELIAYDRAWIFDDKRDDIYSFPYICIQLNIDYRAARKTIREYIERENESNSQHQS